MSRCVSSVDLLPGTRGISILMAVTRLLSYNAGHSARPWETISSRCSLRPGFKSRPGQMDKDKKRLPTKLPYLKNGERNISPASP